MQQSLSEKAMLCTLSISTWQARRYDEGISQQVATQHGTTKKAGRYTKNLLPMDTPSYDAVMNAVSTAREIYHRHTLPWSDEGGWRILPATNYLDFTIEMRRQREVIEEAVSRFVADYPRYKEQAKGLLNSMWKEADYPNEYSIQEKFSFRTRYMPLPSSTDFRVAISNSERAQIQEQIEQDVNASFELAMKEIWMRLYDAVSKLSEQLATQTVFRAASIDSLTDLCDVLSRLNVTGNPEFDEMRCRVEVTLLGVTPQDLNKKTRQRQEVKNQIASIIADMSAFM